MQATGQGSSMHSTSLSGNQGSLSSLEKPLGAATDLEVPIPDPPQWKEIMLVPEQPNPSSSGSLNPHSQGSVHKSPTPSASEEPQSEYDCESQDGHPIATLSQSFQKEILNKPLPEQLPPDAYEVAVPVLPATELSASGCKVRIAKCELTEGSLFARQQMVFALLTKPLGWQVQRKSSDFAWLSTALSAQFFGLCVPIMPQKSLGPPQAKCLYEKFLNTLMQSQIFSRSKYFVEFLCQSDPHAFAAVQAEAREAAKVTQLAQLSSPTGSVACLSYSTSEASGVLSRYLNDVEAALQSLQTRSVAVILSLQQVNAKLSGYAEEMKILAAMQSMTETANQRLIYTQIGRALEGWGRYQMEMGEEINDKLNAFFLYRHSEIVAVKHLFVEVEGAFKGYTREEKSLQAKKEKLWTQWGLEEGSFGPLASDKASAFAIMLPAETRDLEAQKVFLDYLFYQAKSEVTRLLAQGWHSEQRHFRKLAVRCDEKAQALSSLWREATLNLSRFFASQ